MRFAHFAAGLMQAIRKAGVTDELRCTTQRSVGFSGYATGR